MAKQETSKTVLSPRQLAEAIGVSESSIKRWVDDGEIFATRTAGGHRRIAATEAVRFVRRSAAFVVKPELLGIDDLAAIAGGSPAVGEEAEAEALYRYLAEGAAAEARGLLASLYVRGRSVAQIVDGPLRLAMERLGELWRREEPGIYREHRATDIAIQAVNRLRLLQEVPADAPRAVGGAPAGDPYILPSLCVSAVLESLGVAAVNLGPDTPLESLELAADDLEARLVWLSVSVSGDASRLGRGVRRLANAGRRLRRPVVVGGSRAAKLQLFADDLIYVGSSMAELEALVRGLRLGAAGVSGDGDASD